MKCPTEIAISWRRDKELSDNGFMALVHEKNADDAAFFSAQSLNKPQHYTTHAATASANLSARLPYMFAVSRFAHYLMHMVYDKVGEFTSREQLKKELNEWIMGYVEPNPESAGQEGCARRPLSAAEVLVEDVEGNPGYYTASFNLRPHYQLEAITVSLSLVSNLPAGKPE